METPHITSAKQEQVAYLSGTPDVSVRPEMSKSKSTAERLDAGENESTRSFPTNTSTFNISLNVWRTLSSVSRRNLFFATICATSSSTPNRPHRPPILRRNG